MSCIAIIPARVGSVRIPRKNIRDFRGKPMMQWPIEAAEASGVFDRIVVSTDDNEIEGLALILGCLVARRLTDDGTRGTQEVAAEVLRNFPECTEACVIYPCSPLLTAKDLITASRMFKENGGYVVSSYPDRIQDAGCFYFGEADYFRAGVPLVGHWTTLRAYPGAIDINVESDLQEAERMFDERHA